VLTIRRANAIWQPGGWFDARWHFSFDRYRDPKQMGAPCASSTTTGSSPAPSTPPSAPGHRVEHLRRVGPLPPRGLAGQQRQAGGRRCPSDDLLARGRHALGEERLDGRADALHPVSGSCPAPGASTPPSSSVSTRSRIEPTAGCKSWDRPAPMASTWRRTRARARLAPHRQRPPRRSGSSAAALVRPANQLQPVRSSRSKPAEAVAQCHVRPVAYHP